MTVLEIVASKLRDIGADGLCTNRCGCGVDDLAPCGGIGHDCVAAKRLTGEDAARAAGEDDSWLNRRKGFLEWYIPLEVVAKERREPSWNRLKENGIWRASTSRKRIMWHHDALYIAFGHWRLRVMKPWDTTRFRHPQKSITPRPEVVAKREER